MKEHKGTNSPKLESVIADDGWAETAADIVGVRRRGSDSARKGRKNPMVEERKMMLVKFFFG